MNYFYDIMYSVLRLLRMKFYLFGYELSFWNIFMYVFVGSIFISVIVRWFSGD